MYKSSCFDLFCSIWFKTLCRKLLHYEQQREDEWTNTENVNSSALQRITQSVTDIFHLEPAQKIQHTFPTWVSFQVTYERRFPVKSDMCSAFLGRAGLAWVISEATAANRERRNWSSLVQIPDLKQSMWRLNVTKKSILLNALFIIYNLFNQGEIEWARPFSCRHLPTVGSA